MTERRARHNRPRATRTLKREEGEHGNKEMEFEGRHYDD